MLEADGIVTGMGIQVVRPNMAETRATLIFKAEGGRLRERVVGPRALLTIAEAAAVLGRPVAHVKRAIKARLVRAVCRGSRTYLTLGTCVGFLREEKVDLAVARARFHEPVRSSEAGYRHPLTDFFLHSGGSDFLDDVAPTAGTPKFKDSPSLSFSGGNPWKQIGTWTMTIP